MCPHKYFEENIFFYQKVFIAFGHWAKNVRTFSQFFFDEAVKTAFVCPKEHSGLENVLSIFFGGWPEKCQATGGTFSKNLSKSHCACPEEHLRAVVLKKSLILLLHIEKTILQLSGIFPGLSQKLHSSFPADFFQKVKFFEIKIVFFFIFGHWAENMPVYKQRFWATVF